MMHRSLQSHRDFSRTARTDVDSRIQNPAGVYIDRNVKLARALRDHRLAIKSIADTSICFRVNEPVRGSPISDSIASRRSRSRHTTSDCCS